MDFRCSVCGITVEFSCTNRTKISCWDKANLDAGVIDSKAFHFTSCPQALGISLVQVGCLSSLGLSKDTIFDCYSFRHVGLQNGTFACLYWPALVGSVFVDPPEHVSRQSRTCVSTVVQLRNDNEKEWLWKYFEAHICHQFTTFFPVSSTGLESCRLAK